MAAAQIDAVTTVELRTDPERYRHWQVEVDGPVATVTMAVSPEHGLRDDYELKLNSYDLGVDIELADIVDRLRFEHAGVKAVVLTGGLDGVFCAGANIQMLAGASHDHKVNFCKFTNETRGSIEEATANSGQTWIAAVNGTAAGGGYELALACDEIVLVDDRSSAVSLPEIPLLAVLPGTGGLTRVVDKRHVRRDRADVFATRTEGSKGRQALEWGLVDAIFPRSEFDEAVRERAMDRAASSDRPDEGGLPLHVVEVSVAGDALRSTHVDVDIDRDRAAANITVHAPEGDQPATPDELVAAGSRAWIVAAARELDRALLHLRLNETEVGTWILRTEGDAATVLAAERMVAEHADDWLAREVRLLWGRVLRRLDLSARSLFALIEPGSCFTGVLAELALAADRSYMLDGTWEDDDDPPPPAVIRLTEASDGRYPMTNGISRLESRCWGRPEALAAAKATFGSELVAAAAEEAGLVTFALDDLDWEDEVRLAVEERASFSPDALTGMEANHRFVGPETMETKIFARLTAWQNWIFQRPNAVGPEGALRRFGSGARPDYDRTRV